MITEHGTDAESYIVLPGEGEPVPGQRVLIRAGGQETGTAVSVLEIENPGFGGPPLHVHQRHDEMFYVLEGEYLVQLGDTVTVAPAGSFAYFGRGTRHTFAGSGRMPGRLLNIGLPGGLEQYVRELDRLLAAGADEEALQRHNAAWDTELVGPPIARQAIG
jgi:mannose-6-phosphate isomerase-like protein (cupin superfamily)